MKVARSKNKARTSGLVARGGAMESRSTGFEGGSKDLRADCARPSLSGGPQGFLKWVRPAHLMRQVAPRRECRHAVLSTHCCLVGMASPHSPHTYSLAHTAVTRCCV